jgi:hypothetical protein
MKEEEYSNFRIFRTKHNILKKPFFTFFFFQILPTSKPVFKQSLLNCTSKELLKVEFILNQVVLAKI